MSFETMTVRQLREECKARGLPAWQKDRKRLLKRDLIAQLKAAAPRSRKRPVKTASPPKPPANPEPVSAAMLAGLPSWTLWEMARGVDRLFDPAASRRETLAFLVATGRTFDDLQRCRRTDRAQGPGSTLSGAGWLDSGRALGVRTI